MAKKRVMDVSEVAEKTEKGLPGDSLLSLQVLDQHERQFYADFYAQQAKILVSESRAATSRFHQMAKTGRGHFHVFGVEDARKEIRDRSPLATTCAASIGFKLAFCGQLPEFVEYVRVCLDVHRNSFSMVF